MVEMYKDSECTERMLELRFDDSYVEDMYGNKIDNVVEVGTEVRKKFYVKNPDADGVAIREITAESPFITIVVQNAQLKRGEVTPAEAIFKPTSNILRELDEIENLGERQKKKEQLLRGNIKFKVYRMTRV